MDIGEIQRDLRRKIDKARPVVALVEKGELKVLSEAEEKQVSMYPKWVAALEEAKQGILPVMYGGKPVQAKGPAPSSTPERGVAPASPQAQTGTVDGSETPADLDAIFIRIANEMRLQSTPKQKKILLEDHVKALVSTKQMNAAIKEFDKVSDLRAEVRSGRISNPSKAQIAKVQTYEASKKDVQYWKEFVREQQELIRNGVTAALREMEMGEQTPPKIAPLAATVEMEAADSPSSGAVTAQTVAVDLEAAANEEPSCAPALDEETTVDAADEVDAAPVMVVSAGATSALEASPAASDSEEDPSSEDEAAGEDNDDDDDMFGGFDSVFDVVKQKKQEKKLKQHPSSLPALEVPPAASPTPTDESVAVELGAATAEAAESAAPEPRGIDWSELRYKKFSHKLVFSTAPQAAGPAATKPVQPAAAAGGPPQNGLTDFLTLDIGTRNDASPVKKNSNSVPKPALPPQSPVVSKVFSTITARVAKELEDVKNNRLPNVAVDTLGGDLLTWCVNVAPMDGPLSGVIIPLRLHFNEQYPFVPPTVSSLVDMPHPNIVTSLGTIRNVLCMEHTSAAVWDPRSGAASILRQLQSFFGDEAFSKAKEHLSTTFANKIRYARRDCSRFAATDASLHTPLTPSPEVPLWNGPFAGKGKKPRHGVLVGSGVYRWLHRYAKSGVHPFTVQHCRGDVAGLTIELVAEQDGQGEDFVTFSLNCGSGVIRSRKARRAATSEQQQSSPLSPDDAAHTSDDSATQDASATSLVGKLSAPVKPFSRVESEVDLDTSRWRISIDGVVASDVVLPSGKTGIFVRPQLELSNNCEASIALSLSAKSPLPRDATVSSSASTPHCFLTLATCNSDILGLHVEVMSRSKLTSLPIEVATSLDEYVSVDGFEQVRQRRVVCGRKMDGMIPLLLSPEKSTSCIGELKKQLMRLGRNPNASTLYDPPFRPIAAVFILPAAMNDAARRIAKLVPAGTGRGKKDSGKFDALKQEFACDLRQYTMLLHAFATLALSCMTGTVNECNAALASGAPSGGHVFAWSHFLESSWPEIVRRAFRAETASWTGSASEAFKALSRGKRINFLVSAALARATRTTSVQRLAEDLATRCGAPSDDTIEEAFCAIVEAIPKVSDVDAMEEFLGVSPLLCD